ncbi:hypothetical protein HYC85_021030 [Camellia sinensis]|uniref:Leucine-rich repeat-containing N-terminal plant-type domain-containing protein n=1 Tax=Camellia sinensis TaxID=4442 RepID=A0A7J7GGG7_CAMSI|nr:hypothetical protein HYC85_021030 [Camellia sinensis]
MLGARFPRSSASHPARAKLEQGNGSPFSSNSSNSNPSCIEIERKALVEFKKGLTDPSGRLSSWVGNDCCTWMGVGCSNQTGNVVSLDLRNRFQCFDNSSCLGGEVSNQIMGDISELVGGLVECSNSSLEELWLGDNQVSGQLPDYSLAHLQNLRYLILPINLISGPIPPSIGSSLKLEILKLSYNQMNGSIPDSVGKLANLNSLILEYNYWEGVLSQNHLQGLTKLQSFTISSLNKSLIFNISHEWVPPFSLTYITIHSCQLGPRFPAWLSNQKQLSDITLTDVAISNTIPYWLCELSPHIFWLDLSANRIHEMLPNSLVFPSAFLVDFSFNRLEGSLPFLA